ncbi:TetR/AcrR family transcriptional regulator [Sphingomonas donggukensis]|uniref:TetR/AcrR family transcriptional regulator n=1 Tax=Sphingomonas donggukensis TaxID=2949093 RepID=A0ABY4TZ56_9SPHN|nr:TetR/AcrR family transcriptional regulator [Sphingomonas donggukensis]URW76399.1 TetR/AcrR family transcriptional regulator [Sphingomonas donggukensis]
MIPPCGYERRKDPKKVRAALLDAAAVLICDQGLARMTVDAVARAAGVTKGGLFHHFASRQELIDGVLDEMMAHAGETLAELMAADPDPHGRFTRALLDGIFGDHRMNETVSSRALCLAMLADPNLQQRWAEWIARQVAEHAATDDNVPCAIVRLATDGIWLSSLHQGEGPPPVDAEVRAALTAMTRASP